MIGTGHELLYYFTHDHDARERLGITMPQAFRLRDRCLHNSLSEEVLAGYLTKLNCRKVRDRITLPAILRNKKGRSYTERTILTAIHAEDYPEYDIVMLRRRMCAGDALPSQRIIKCICRREYLKVECPRIELPSVWEYDPTGRSGVREVSVEKIIGY